jgi:antitoxin ParD1/3/4
VAELDTLEKQSHIITMPSKSSLNVSLTPELEQFVQGRVKTGRYQTASEVVREGLRLLELQEKDREEAHKALKAKLHSSAAQAERGDLIDGEKVFKKLDALIERHRTGRRRKTA